MSPDPNAANDFRMLRRLQDVSPLLQDGRKRVWIGGDGNNKRADRNNSTWQARRRFGRKNRNLALRLQKCLNHSNMNLKSLTSGDLKKLVGLLEQRESLQAQVANIDAELAKFESGALATPAASAESKPGRKPGRRAKAAKHGGVKPGKAKGPRPGGTKERIIELVKGAGKDGVTVKDVAAKLKAKLVNIRVWFATTGKGVKEIKKVAPAKFAWVG